MPLLSKTETLREFAGVDWIDDGYEFMEAGRGDGWRDVAGWGADGWDLGSWPYVVVLFREVVVTWRGPQPWPTDYERAVYVEGDITVETWDTAAEREQATDELARFHWRAAGRDAVGDELWNALAATPDDRPLPERFRGPYRARTTTTEEA